MFLLCRETTVKVSKMFNNSHPSKKAANTINAASWPGASNCGPLARNMGVTWYLLERQNFGPTSWIRICILIIQPYVVPTCCMCTWVVLIPSSTIVQMYFTKADTKPCAKCLTMFNKQKLVTDSKESAYNAGDLGSLG